MSSSMPENCQSDRVVCNLASEHRAAEPLSPPILLANVQDKNGHTVGVVRLCWLPAEDHCAEIQFQGTGNAFRNAIKKICSDVDGSLTEKAHPKTSKMVHRSVSAPPPTQGRWWA